jgi:hypothetical protein
MENKNQLSIGGRVALSGCCEGRIETTSNIQTKYILKSVGLDTANEHRLLAQRITHL